MEPQQIAVPAFVSTLAICIVFVPVLLLTGAAKYLFTPLAMAVVFAMMMSYFLSRTLVPTMVHFLLRPEVALYQQGGEHAQGEGIIWRVHGAFNHQFEAMRSRYRGALHWSLEHRGPVIAVFAIFCLGSLGFCSWWARTSFPISIPARCAFTCAARRARASKKPSASSAKWKTRSGAMIPHEEIDTILDNIGLPPGGFNLAFSDSSTIGNGDGEILVSLNQEKHGSTLDYERKLRAALHDRFPEETIFFQAANITNQILNFGLPAPIDVQVVGRDTANNYKIAQELQRRIAGRSGRRGRAHPSGSQLIPQVDVNVDRSKADQLGLTQRDVANSLLISLSSSGQLAPNQWLNPQNGVNYQVAVQTPQYRIDSFDALQRTPITAGNAAPTATPNCWAISRR